MGNTTSGRGRRGSRPARTTRQPSPRELPPRAEARRRAVATPSMHSHNLRTRGTGRRVTVQQQRKGRRARQRAGLSRSPATPGPCDAHRKRGMYASTATSTERSGISSTRPKLRTERTQATTVVSRTCRHCRTHLQNRKQTKHEGQRFRLVPLRRVWAVESRGSLHRAFAHESKEHGGSLLCPSTPVPTQTPADTDRASRSHLSSGSGKAGGEQDSPPPTSDALGRELLIKGEQQTAAGVEAPEAPGYAPTQGRTSWPPAAPRRATTSPACVRPAALRFTRPDTPTKTLLLFLRVSFGGYFEKS